MELCCMVKPYAVCQLCEKKWCGDCFDKEEDVFDHSTTGYGWYDFSVKQGRLKEMQRLALRQFTALTPCLDRFLKEDPHMKVHLEFVYDRSTQTPFW